MSWKGVILLVAGALVGLLLVGVAGLYALTNFLESGLFEGRPTRVTFVDTPVGIIDPAELRLSGDLLLADGRGAGLDAIPLSDLSREPTVLAAVPNVTSVGPDAAYALGYGSAEWQVLRLSDLNVVAEIDGGEPLFLDRERMLLIGQADDCRRRDATVIDLAARSTRTVRLSGDKAGLDAVAVDGGHVVAQRLGKGDSGCAVAGFARVDLATGRVTTVAKSGNLAVATGRHAWVVDDGTTTVFEGATKAASHSSPVVAFAIGERVLYAAYEWPPVYPQQPAPSVLRLGSVSGPQPGDPAGAGLREPSHAVALPGGAAALVLHRTDDGRAYALSRCTLPDLRCTKVAEGASASRPVAVVPAKALTG